MNEGHDTLTLGSVRITAEDVAEVADGTAVVLVQKSGITGIEMKRALAAERPIPQFLFGLALTIPGFFFSRVLWSWLLFDGTLHVEITLWFILFVPVGLWLAFSAFRKRVLLHVHTERDHRKIVFKGRHTSEELRSLAAKANERFGYTIHVLLDA